ncbi:MAG: TonB family protein [Bacteroidetes bacterium]|nr:TonB family protein [Bacteroidota bacterium]MBU1116875.1 TonB family protein [Bacteroidota bacterium]MBU1797447.1 TonB family protein [Bacteroidota bacterium]
MKKLILVLFAIITLFACEEKSKIEIITDLDIQYFPINMVDTMSRFVSAKPEPLPFGDVIKIIHETENPNEEVIYPVYIRLYVNEFGKIDKIKTLPHNLDVLTRNNSVPKYKELIYSKTETIVKKALPKLEKYEFIPAKLLGNDVKSRADIKVIYKANKNGDVTPDLEKMKLEHVGSDFDDPVQGIYFVAVEEMPLPIGGIAAIQKNITYPEIAKRAGIQGRVYVKAFIDSTGTVVKAVVVKGIGAGCDEVAMEAVKKVKFTPGKQRGKAVNVQVTVPILFKLDDTVSEIKKPKAKDEILLKATKDESQNGLAKLSGIIISQDNGLPVVASSISLKGTKLGCASNEKGEFFISKIPKGEYNLLVSSNSATHNMGKIKMTPDKTEIVELIIATKE